jgi:hypothetical protein
MRAPDRSAGYLRRAIGRHNPRIGKSGNRCTPTDGPAHKPQLSQLTDSGYEVRVRTNSRSG